MPAPIICCLLTASCMALPSVYVIDWFPVLYFGIVWALVLVDVLCYEALLCHWLMLAAMGVSGCRSWNLFFCLFLHFTWAVPSTWALLLQVHVASGIVCLRLLCQAGLDSIRACFPWLFQTTISCILFLLCWGWGGASNQTSVGFKSMLSAENLARTHACSG